MGNTKAASDHGIQRGDSPKSILRQRGVRYDGVGFIPQLPDYLGYLAGIVLIWLVYTTYSSVVAVFSETPSIATEKKAEPVVEAPEVVPERVDKIESLNQRVLSLESRRAEEKVATDSEKTAVEEEPKGYFDRAMGYAEGALNRVTAAGSAAAGKLFGSDEPGQVEHSSETTSESATGVVVDSLDRF